MYYIFLCLKYILCKDISVTKIPDFYKDSLEFSIKLDGAVKYYNYITDKLLDLKNMIKNSNDEKVVIEIMFNRMSRFV